MSKRMASEKTSATEGTSACVGTLHTSGVPVRRAQASRKHPAKAAFGQGKRKASDMANGCPSSAPQATGKSTGKRPKSKIQSSGSNGTSTDAKSVKKHCDRCLRCCGLHSMNLLSVKIDVRTLWSGTGLCAASDITWLPSAVGDVDRQPLFTHNRQTDIGSIVPPPFAGWEPRDDQEDYLSEQHYATVGFGAGMFSDMRLTLLLLVQEENGKERRRDRLTQDEGGPVKHPEHRRLRNDERRRLDCAAATTPSDASRQGTLWEMADSDRNAMDGDSVNESDRTRELTLEIEALKLKLELEKMRSSRASSEEPEMRNRHTVTDQLTTSASVLLTPKDYECLRRCREELMSDLNECEKGIRCIAQEIVPERCLSLREQEKVSRGSNPSANAVQRTLEEPPRGEHQVPNTESEANTSLEDEREGEQDAQALKPLATSSMSGLEQGQLESQNSVGEHIIEDSERLGPVTEISSAEEQKRDESLADAWRQAKEGSHGMVIDAQFHYHREQLGGNIEMAPQAVKSCGQVSAAAQASKLSPSQGEEPSAVLHEYREVMTAPDPSKPFCLATDASETAIGACLSQRMGDTERPVAFLRS
ncbi:hypothetical protein HPB50_010968 [Hyalomma asiaticum]|uniref:Uncharacterized protein n=1 Tax=Hyalomma asiaticum TaxID=266040 RepID=A0ACB7TIK6_HYAAI|nr:hypothetical protein HPB50_010968 [Hyalomma asiaticum]